MIGRGGFFLRGGEGWVFGAGRRRRARRRLVAPSLLSLKIGFWRRWNRRFRSRKRRRGWGARGESTRGEFDLLAGGRSCVGKDAASGEETRTRPKGREREREREEPPSEEKKQQTLLGPPPMTATRSLRPSGSFSPSLMAATDTVRLRVLCCRFGLPGGGCCFLFFEEETRGFPLDRVRVASKQGRRDRAARGERVQRPPSATHQRMGRAERALARSCCMFLVGFGFESASAFLSFLGGARRRWEGR
jgi:hypothetical protein